LGNSTPRQTQISILWLESVHNCSIIYIRPTLDYSGLFADSRDSGSGCFHISVPNSVMRDPGVLC
jgi:hypothetical protein